MSMCWVWFWVGGLKFQCQPQNKYSFDVPLLAVSFGVDKVTQGSVASQVAGPKSQPCQQPHTLKPKSPNQKGLGLRAAASKKLGMTISLVVATIMQLHNNSAKEKAGALESP